MAKANMTDEPGCILFTSILHSWEQIQHHSIIQLLSNTFSSVTVLFLSSLHRDLVDAAQNPRRGLRVSRGADGPLSIAFAAKSQRYVELCLLHVPQISMCWGIVLRAHRSNSLNRYCLDVPNTLCSYLRKYATTYNFQRYWELACLLCEPACNGHAWYTRSIHPLCTTVHVDLLVIPNRYTWSPSLTRITVGGTEGWHSNWFNSVQGHALLATS